ncbi:MAG: hypothetical protein ISS35_09350 [Kiritimatiellae bacterium]|nr:hypothetical protein [Kiritimatiellia bacterium]
MVYVKTSLNPGEEIVHRAEEILNHCHAINLADLSGKLGMAMERVRPALGAMISRGVVEELCPVGRSSNMDRSSLPVARDADRYYRWVRENDGNFEWQLAGAEAEKCRFRCIESWQVDRVC